MYLLSKDLVLSPHILVSSAIKEQSTLDFNLRIEKVNFIWAGISYRSVGALNFLIGTYVKNRFSFGYSFDKITSKLSNYAKGTHELVIGISFAPITKKEIPHY